MLWFNSSATDLINACFWIIGIGGFFSIILFVLKVIALADFLAIVGVIISATPILLDIGQRRFQTTILAIVLGGLTADQITVLKEAAKGEKNLDEIAAETRLGITRLNTVVSDLCIRGFLEEIVRNGRTCFRLTQLGRTTVRLRTSQEGAQTWG